METFDYPRKRFGVDSAFNVFVGIDFGTTYSGFAFAVGRDSSRIYIQPQAGTQNNKMPTALLLDKELRLIAFGDSAASTYFEDDDDSDEEMYYFDRFKMNLHNDRDVRGSSLLTAANGKTVEARIVFARALEYFVKTASEEIPRATGVSLRKDEIRWIVTVPAIWGDRAKEFMKQAAVEAGIENADSVEIALEPEAAALSSRTDLQSAWLDLEKPPVLRYIVVDCGGGTVDVTVHDLKVATNLNQIDEVELPSGDAWGGTTVDRKIEKLVQRFFGEEFVKKVERKVWLQFSRIEIEDAKRKVTNNTTGKVSLKILHEMNMAVHDSEFKVDEATRRMPGLRFRRKQLLLSVDLKVMEECFKEPLECIVSHVKIVKEKAGNVNAILVVGGFAESSLLIRHMEEELKSDTCRVIRPTNASLAVVRGAVMYGQNPNLIQTRIARRSYGVEVSVPFDEAKHSLRRRVVINGKDFCRSVFVPYVRRGDRMEIDSPKSIVINPTKSTQKGMFLQFYSSSDRDTEYTDDPACEKLLDLRVTMPRVEEGDKRAVKATVDFSRTTIHVTAIDQSSMQQADKTISYPDL